MTEQPAKLATRKGRSRRLRWLWGMAAGLLCTFVAAVFGAPDRTPYHGFFHGLSPAECLILVWIPLSAFTWARSEVPRRWWLYYGLLAFLAAWPTFMSLLLYGGGRRSWVLNSTWHYELALSLTYFAVSPWLAACCKLGLAGQRTPANPQARDLRPEE